MFKQFNRHRNFFVLSTVVTALLIATETSAENVRGSEASVAEIYNGGALVEDKIVSEVTSRYSSPAFSTVESTPDASLKSEHFIIIDEAENNGNVTDTSELESDAEPTLIKKRDTMIVIIAVGSVAGVGLLVASVFLAVSLHRKYHPPGKLSTPKLESVYVSSRATPNKRPSSGFVWSNPNFRPKSVVDLKPQDVLNHISSPKSTIHTVHAVYESAYFQDPQSYDQTQIHDNDNDFPTNAKPKSQSVEFNTEDREECMSPSPTPTESTLVSQKSTGAQVFEQQLHHHKISKVQRRQLRLTTSSSSSGSIPKTVGMFNSDPTDLSQLMLSQQELDELFVQSLSPTGAQQEQANDGTPGTHPLFLLSPEPPPKDYPLDVSPSSSQSTLWGVDAESEREASEVFHPKFLQFAMQGNSTTDVFDSGSDDYGLPDDAVDGSMGYWKCDQHEIISQDANGCNVVKEVYFVDESNDGDDRVDDDARAMSDDDTTQSGGIHSSLKASKSC